jgi:hypothetical protein
MVTGPRRQRNFEQSYGGWWERNIQPNGKGVISGSVEHYLHAIGMLPLP